MFSDKCKYCETGHAPGSTLHTGRNVRMWQSQPFQGDIQILVESTGEPAGQEGG